MSEAFITRADQAGVYYLPATRRAALESTGGKTRLRRVNLVIPKGTDARELLNQLGAALAFPDWYGANFDALFDCLTDPDTLPKTGVLLLLTGCAGLHKADPQGSATLLEVLQTAAVDLGQQGKPFWVLLDSPGKGIAKLPQA